MNKKSAAELVSELAVQGQLSESAQSLMGIPGKNPKDSSFGMGGNPFLSGSGETAVQTNMMSGDPGSAASSPAMNISSSPEESTAFNNNTETVMGMGANRAVPKLNTPETSPIRSEYDIENQIIPDPESTQAAKA